MQSVAPVPGRMGPRDVQKLVVTRDWYWTWYVFVETVSQHNSTSETRITERNGNRSKTTLSMCDPAAVGATSEKVMVVDVAVAVKFVLNLCHLNAAKSDPSSSNVAMICPLIEAVKVLCTVGRGEW